MVGTSAAAQSFSDPYGEPQSARSIPPPRPSEGLVPAPSARPYLDPMDGRLGSTERDRPASEPAYEPYKPVPYAPVDAQAPPAQGEAPALYQPGSVGREALPEITSQAPPADERRADLAPSAQPGRDVLPFELWKGMSEGEIERLFGSLVIPPRSPALAHLWRRLIESHVAPPSGASGERFAALRVEALDRSGHTGLARRELALLSRQQSLADPLVQLLEARLEISDGDRAKGCASAKAVAGSKENLPKLMKAEAILMTGFCVAADGNAQGAGIAAELARENGLEGRAGLTALDAISTATKPDISSAKTISFLDYRLLELAGIEADPSFAARASPGLAVHLATDKAQRPEVRLAAAEIAVSLNAIEPSELRDIYRSQAANGAPDTLISDAAAETVDPAIRRGVLANAAYSERTPQKKARYIRAFLDDALRAGFYWAALSIMSEAAAALEPIPEIGWFSETATECAIVAGDEARARTWVQFGASLDRPAGNLDHWMALVEITAPATPESNAVAKASIEKLATDARFEPVLLHRVVTVIDALGAKMPIPLWDAASRTPQPASGHLPETGVLSRLQEASKKPEFGHTVLLAMQALGPAGSEGAHMIALGDSIRALKRASLEEDARRLALEALLGSWPRAMSN